MPDPHQPDATLREELVAYLDGELPPEEARAVEERLSRDERYRREMQGFDRAWNALEELPRATVDDSFTKTTIEMVAVAAEKDLAEQTQTVPLVRRKRTLWITAVAAIAATLGFALARIALDRPDRVLLANLPIVQHLDAYDQDLSPEFLTALHTKARDILEPYQDEELERQLEAYREIDAATTSERREIVEKMSDGEKAALRANYFRFVETLTPESREHLVDLHRQLRDDPNSAELQRTMLAYWAWLQERRNGGADQADLRGADSTAKRLALMHGIEHGQSRRFSLSPEEAKKLRATVRGLAQDQQFRTDLFRLLGERPRGPESSERKEPGPSRIFVRSILKLRMAAREDPDNPQLRALSDRVHAELLSALSLETRASVDRQDPPGPPLFVLVWQAMLEDDQPSEEELETFFASGAISASRTQELLAMPRERMLRELKQEYLREQFGSEGPWRWREGRREDHRGPRGEPFEERDRPPGGPPDGPRRRGDSRFNDFPDVPPGPPDGRERRRPGPPPPGKPFGPPPDGQRPPPPRLEEAAI